MRRRTIAVILVLAATAPLARTAPRARAEEQVRLVAPGVELRSFQRIDPEVGLQEVRVLRFRPDDAAVRLRPVAAVDHGAPRLRVSDLVLRSGAVAAVNGNFFTADGNSRGILVTDGVLRSEPEAPVNGAPYARAAWLLDAGGLAFGRPAATARWFTDGRAFGLNGLERRPGYLGNPDETVLVTSRSAAASPAPPEGVDVVLGGLPPLRAGTPLTATVTTVRTGQGPVPAGGGVLTATGANAAEVAAAGIADGDVVRIDVDLDDTRFAAAEWAGGGGPYLVRSGAPVAREDQLAEGFTVRHLDVRAPRTAIGRTGDGTVLLVTVDGRQPGRSAGATLAGLARLLVELGATEAISLDGGGSTTMSVDGRVVNVPSGEDDRGGRGVEAAVTDAVGVFVDFRPVATRRLAGADRVATAVLLSNERQQAPAVVVATTAGFADALVGGPLAAEVGGPVLLTGSNGLAPPVRDEIRRLAATTAYVLGGVAALSPQVEADLIDAGISDVRRIAGPDRYATAAAVANTMRSSATVLVASGETFPDAVSAGALGLPVVLTTRDTLPDATRSVIASRTPVVVGGPAAVADGVVPRAERVSGPDRYATSARVADWGLGKGRFDASRVLVARGDAFPDALVGGALRRPVLLVDPIHLDRSPATRDWLRDRGATIESAVLLGGRLALSTMNHALVEQYVAVPAPVTTTTTAP